MQRHFFVDRVDHDKQTEFLECPNCGKRALVARTKDEYACLNCNFRKDLSMPQIEGSAGSLLAGAITGLAVLLL